jgi:hypothetical protein
MTDLRAVRQLLVGVIAGFVMTFLALVAGFQRLDAERHDRCVNSRTDTQAAIVAVITEFRPDDVALRSRAAGVVADALPVDEC